MSRVTYEREPVEATPRARMTPARRRAVLERQGPLCAIQGCGKAIGRPPQDIHERFLRHIEPDTNGGCWLWTSGVQKRTGYGEFRLNGRTEKAHRVCYRLFRGEIPAGLCVLHRCDVRSCVNPDHLFLGTYADNTADMNRKGRGNPRKGDDCSWRKLSRAQAEEIRRTYPRETLKALADQYGVSFQLISQIIRGDIWR